MVLRKMRSAAIAGSIIATLASETLAQSVAPVSPDDEVHTTIALLAAIGLLDSVVVGPHSLSQREAARLLRQANERLTTGDIHSRRWVTAAIERALARLPAERVRPLDLLTISGTVLDSPTRSVPSDPSGQIDAVIHPLRRVGGGQDLSEGATAMLQSQHTIAFGAHAAIVFAPRLVQQSARAGRATTSFVVDRGFVSLALGNARLDVGRDYTVLGQAPSGGLLLSTYAAALDQVRIGTDRPIRLPGPLARLGLLHASGLIADLGAAQQTFPHPKLVVYDLSILPHPRLELGMRMLDEMGGQGSPGGPFYQRVLDVIPLGNLLYSRSDLIFSNKLAGLDVRWRAIRRLGLDLYVEAVADDFDKRRVIGSLRDDSGYLVGAAMSCFLSCGRTTVSAEFHRTGLRYYAHQQFVSGVTLRGELLGDPLGPRASGWYVTAARTTARYGRFALASAYEIHDGTLYYVHTDPPDDRNWHFVPLEWHPNERRVRSIATWSIEPQRRLSVSFGSGIERTTNVGFTPGTVRVGGIARAMMTYRP